MQEVKEIDYESLVCDIYGIDRCCLANNGHKRRCGAITECLHIIVYMLHYRAGKSAREIALRYSMSSRNAKYIASKIRHGVAYQPYYRNIIERIDSALEERTAPEDSGTVLRKEK